MFCQKTLGSRPRAARLMEIGPPHVHICIHGHTQICNVCFRSAHILEPPLRTRGFSQNAASRRCFMPAKKEETLCQLGS
jgi:hypothetical protein